MASYLKGIYGYIIPGSVGDSSGKKDDNIRSAPPSISDASSTTSVSSAEDTPPSLASSQPSDSPMPATSASEQTSYLGKAVYGVASGIYSVGSGTVGAGVSGVKWIAGTTYSVSSGVVSGAGSVVGAVASGASSVVSKATSTKSKEHCD